MNQKAHDEGKRAAGEDIPAEANPYKPGTPESEAWAEGHASVATAIEASEGEGT